MQTKTLMTWFIIGTMVLSTLGFVITMGSGDLTKVRYHGYSFNQGRDGRWLTTIAGQQVSFSTVPDQLETLAVPDDVFDLLLNTRALAVTYDAQSFQAQDFSVVQYEFATLMTRLRGGQTYVFPALANATNVTLPSVSCANATASIPVLMLDTGNTTEVVREGFCVIARSTTPSALIAMTDRLIYALVGVMPR